MDVAAPSLGDVADVGFSWRNLIGVDFSQRNWYDFF